MDFQAAARICKISPTIFARPGSWRGRGWALDLAGRLDKQRRVRAISPINLKSGIYYQEAWVPKAHELVEDWYLVSAPYLSTEYKDAMERAADSSGDTCD